MSKYKLDTSNFCYDEELGYALTISADNRLPQECKDLLDDFAESYRTKIYYQDYYEGDILMEAEADNDGNDRGESPRDWGWIEIIKERQDDE